MGAAPKIIDKKTLQTLVPFNALSPMHFNEVAQKTVVEEVRAGRLVFKEGDRDNQSVYLLEGEINLLAGNEVVGAIAAGSDASRHPIAQQQPRQVSARAKSNVVVARIDSSLLDIMLTWDQSSGYEVSEISEDDDDDWMTRILQSQAFLKLPPSNIQRLLMKVESISVSAGEVIIRQGGDGDYFYIIKNGRCMVTRKPSANAKEVKLAELADGDAFGEDALVSDAKRNATITMMTDGVLMRLAKKDFVELLKEPLLSKLNYQDAVAKVAKGAVWLDVRLPGEYENVHIPGGRNIPLSALRLEANGLDHAVKYIVCCDTGRRSASAAFVLSQRGFEVYILNEGLASVPAEALEGNAVTVPAAPSNPEPAAVVELKPHAISAVPAQRPAVADTAELAALQERVEALQQEKQTLETARQQLGGRVGDLQDELERVRDESREQIQELEQIIDAARKDSAAARAELQTLQETLNKQRQSDGTAREQVESLESELTERRAREDQLQAEFKALQDRAVELETALQAGKAQWAEIDTERAKLQVRVEELQPLLEQIEAQRAQVAGLETALQNATRQGDQAQAQQVQRLSELEAALQVATAALERAHQETAQRVAELEAARDQAQNVAAQQVADMQARLEQATALHAELESRLNAAQLQVGSGHDEIEAQRSRAEEAVRELAQLRENQSVALEALRQESEGLRAELETQLAAKSALQAERDALSAAATDSANIHAELQGQLQEARARIEALSADAGEQVRQLQVALETAQREAQSAGDGRAAAAAELVSAQERLTKLDDELNLRREAAQDLEQRLQAAEEAVTVARGEQAAQQESLSAAQQSLQQLEARLADVQQDAAQTRDAYQAELAALQAQLAAQGDGRTAADEQLRALEARLAEMQAEAIRRDQEQQAALASVQTERDAAERAREELSRQLSDTSSSQDEQVRQLAQLREDLHTAQIRIQESDAARSEIEGRLAEMSAAAEQAQMALAEAEQHGRAALESQLEEVRGELEGARAALAREQSQRSNLEQATQAEFEAAQSEISARLEEAEQALSERQQALAEAEAARQALKAQLDEARGAAADQQQVLVAELEQLREATTADLQAMGRQVQQLQEELKAARRLSAGGAASEEIERLRLLLDEAREEAGSARADADEWREQAGASASAETDGIRLNDELAAMRIQLADAQSGIQEAQRARDSAQEEVAQLRQVLQERPQTAVMPPQQLTEARPAGRAGMWMGLAAGLLLGGIGVGAALWPGQGSQTVVQPSIVEAPASASAAMEGTGAAQHPAAQPKPAAAAETSAVSIDSKDEPVDAGAEKPRITAGRAFHDRLSDGNRGPQMVEVAAAEFLMGSGANSLDFDERPRHEVKLRRFAIAKTEVTFEDYDAFARATGRRLPDDKGWGRGRRPVINVSWEDAIAYTHWLSEQTGKRYRLPSEAEWEYAAGGFARTLYWWGNTPGEGRANCFNCASQWDAKTSAPAASFAANPLGLHDTSGNVSEWVQDCYHPSYEAAPADGTAWVEVGCARRVIRGGGFNSPANTLRTAKRDQQTANMRADEIGFRVAREL